MKHLRLKTIRVVLMQTGIFLMSNPLALAQAAPTEPLNSGTTLSTENNSHTKSVLNTNNDSKTPKADNKQNLSQLDVGGADDWTLAEERKIGDEIAIELFQDPDLIDDPLLSEYVQSIGAQLINTAYLSHKISPEMYKGFAWKFILGKDKSVNAFALPGAYFGVHLGLISMTQSRDELASVLAHEISHVTQRHISRNNAHQKKMAPALIGAMILGAILSSQSNTGGQAAMIGAQALGAQSQLNYSRDMEREADRFGYQLLKEAGYNENSFVAMFEKLQYSNRLADSGNFPYLRSHPLTTERIGDMKARDLNEETTRPLELNIENPVPQNNTPITLLANQSTSQIEHMLIAARSKLLSNQNNESVKAWKQDIQNRAFNSWTIEKKSHLLMLAAIDAAQQNQNAEAEKYALQLWQLLSNHLNNVVANKNQIEAQDPLKASRLVALFLAEFYVQQVNTAQAQYWLLQAEKLNGLMPSSAAVAQDIELISISQGKNKRPELFIKAQLASKGIQTESTLNALKNWLAFFPQDARAWQYLSSIYEFQQNKLGQLRALAEVEIAQMNWAGAKERLRAAQLWADTHTNLSSQQRLDLAIIDSRLSLVNQSIRERQIKK
jgi:predicted Zn-dependent protease